MSAEKPLLFIMFRFYSPLKYNSLLVFFWIAALVWRMKNERWRKISRTSNAHYLMMSVHSKDQPGMKRISSTDLAPSPCKIPPICPAKKIDAGAATVRRAYTALCGKAFKVWSHECRIGQRMRNECRLTI